MGIIDDIKQDATALFKEAASIVKTAKAAWKTFSSTQNRALALKLFGDAVKIVNDITGDVAAGGVNLALDAETVNDIKTIIADAKAGDKVILSDLALLGVKL